MKSGLKAGFGARAGLLLGALVFALPAASGANSTPPAAEPFFFIQMADPQFGMFATPTFLADPGFTWDDDDFERETALFEQAIAHANRLNPAFVVICGDLVNTPGHAGQTVEFERIRRTLRSDVPLYLVACNHDVENEPTPASLAWYRSTFGSDWYTFRHGDLQGIVLNSPLIKAPDGAAEAAREQLTWLKATLAAPAPPDVRHRFVFQHHPLFLEDPDEEDQYFNLPRARRQVYLQLFREHGVSHVFAGHYHRNSHGRDGELEMITTGPVGRPLGDDPSGFRVVEVWPDRVEHSYYGLAQVPERVGLEPIAR